MSSLIDERTQFEDEAGKPIVGGFIYIGVQGADPVLNPITIFSDRELTTTISNPQVLDSFGQSTNKIWIPGRYSMKIEDLNNVQQYQELDNGAEISSGVTTLDNVIGANTITAEATDTIEAYTDKEVYVFTTAQSNTSDVTLNIDTVGAKSVTKNIQEEIASGEMGADQVQAVIFNESTDEFQWLNQVAEVVTPPTRVLIETIEISTQVATVEFTDISGFDNYAVVFEGVIPETDNDQLLMRLGTGATPDFQSGADYSYSVNVTSSGNGAAVYTGINATNQTQAVVCGAMDNTSGFSNILTEINLAGFSDASKVTTWNGSGVNASALNIVTANNPVGSVEFTTAITALQFFATNDDLTDGKFKLYGLN